MAAMAAPQHRGPQKGAAAQDRVRDRAQIGNNIAAGRFGQGAGIAVGGRR